MGEGGLPVFGAMPASDFEAEDARAREELKSDLGNRAVRSAAWRGAANVSTALVRLGVMAVLARLLSPHAFGVVAMSAVVTALAGQISAFGLGSALIQRTALTPGQLWWVFRVNLGLSLGLSAGCVAASPWVSRFFHEPLVGPVLAVSAAALPIGAIALVPRALLTRQLEFRKLAACEFTGALATAVASVTMALTDLGVWSLVVGSLVGGAASSGLALRLAPWRPSRAARAEGCLPLLKFGGAVAVTGILNYWAFSIANVVVGRVLGAAALGSYTVAYSFASMPVAQLTGLASSVAFPAFSAIKDDRRRLSLAYLRCVRWSATLALPACAMMAALAPQLVEVVLGPKWTASVLPLRLLLALVSARALYTFAGSVLLSVGRPHIELLFQALFCAGAAGSAYLGSRAGVDGVAAALAMFVCFLAAPVNTTITARAAGTGPMAVLRTAAAPAGAAALAGTVAWATGKGITVLCEPVSGALLLAAGVLLGTMTYGLCIWWRAKDLLSEGRYRLRDLLRARSHLMLARTSAPVGQGGR
jgi:PST family polysaccharide transporter